ncbi:MAG: hypothetical protein J3K34DRAFT_519057 [Monoraphidium minutum]|nr:MAG: hypothetical protein J3K34DRAFT_519057 [Monoraphidium minutum]
MFFSRIVRAAAGHAHHAPKPYVYVQGPNDGIFSKVIPTLMVCNGVGIVGYGITTFMFGESGN